MSENKVKKSETAATETKLIEIDFGNRDSIIETMDKYHHLDQMIFARNELEELQAISIYEDKIFVDTYQSNGWIRKNIYHRDGTIEETYEKDGKQIVH